MRYVSTSSGHAAGAPGAGHYWLAWLLLLVLLAPLCWASQAEDFSGFFSPQLQQSPSEAPNCCETLEAMAKRKVREILPEATTPSRFPDTACCWTSLASPASPESRPVHWGHPPSLIVLPKSHRLLPFAQAPPA